MTMSPEEIRDRVPNPIEIISKLDQYIIGQKSAKKALSLMTLNRALVLLYRYGLIDLASPLEKSNVLLIGPTGSGKTALIKSLSEVVGFNISIFDVSSITAAGYIGSKIEDILIRYVNQSIEYIKNNSLNILEGLPESSEVSGPDNIRRMVETGIVYLDEIDKIKMRIHHTSDTDINGEMVQNELLKVLEGGCIDLTNSKTNKINTELGITKTYVENFRTDNLFFICGGAFAGLDEIILKRINKKSGIGFLSELKKDENSIISNVSTEDLINYGFKPEFLGRIPLRASLSPMTKEILMKIIHEPKNSILDQYKGVFKVFGIDLSIDSKGLESIAELALDLKLGARSLKAIFLNILSDQLCNIFSYTDKQFVIDEELVKSKGLGNEV